MRKYEIVRLLYIRNFPKDLWKFLIKFTIPKKKRFNIKRVYGNVKLNILPPIIVMKEFQHIKGRFTIECCKTCDQIRSFRHKKHVCTIETYSYCQCCV